MSLRWLLPFAIVSVAACSSMGDAFMHVADVRVTEVRRANDCGPATPKPQMQIFADRGALETWQLAQKLEFPNGRDDALPPGVYALIEYPIEVGAMVVSREAHLRQDGQLTLNASFLEQTAKAPFVQLNTFAPSACILVALPRNLDVKVQVLVLRDQAGNERARADSKTKISVHAETSDDMPASPISEPVRELPPPKFEERP